MSKETGVNPLQDGGPAFPVTITDKSGQIAPTFEGMTLRDYFAAKAMQTLIGQTPTSNQMGTRHANAILAYNIADTMLAERDK